MNKSNQTRDRNKKAYTKKKKEKNRGEKGKNWIGKIKFNQIWKMMQPKKWKKESQLMTTS